MHINALDQYHDAASPVHRLDPRVKLLGAIGFILACALMPDGAWLAFLALFVLWFAVVLLSDVPHLLLLKRGLVALPFALAAVTVLFTLPGQALLTLHIPVVNWQLTITDNGAIRFGTILFKSWLSVLMAMLLVATTTFPDMMPRDAGHRRTHGPGGRDFFHVSLCFRSRRRGATPHARSRGP